MGRTIRNVQLLQNDLHVLPPNFTHKFVYIKYDFSLISNPLGAKMDQLGPFKFFGILAIFLPIFWKLIYKTHYMYEKYSFKKHPLVEFPAATDF